MTGNERESSALFWHDFWNSYFPSEPRTDQDLLRQVASTINKEPVPLETIKATTKKIESILRLSETDELVDFCCGNGIIDFELAPRVRTLIGVDFSEKLISAAVRMKMRPNLRYILGNVTLPFSLLIPSDVKPTKFLMVSSLGYFQPGELESILRNIVRHLEGRKLQFLVAAIPDFALRANFYDTPQRIARYLQNERTRPDTNDGIGRWWRAEEIETICSKNRLSVRITNRTVDGSKYRMDALIYSEMGDSPTVRDTV